MTNLQDLPAKFINCLHYYAWYDADNRLHNPNGPAVEFYDGIKEYWIHGIRKYEENNNLLLEEKYENV